MNQPARRPRPLLSANEESVRAAAWYAALYRRLPSTPWGLAVLLVVGVASKSLGATIPGSGYAHAIFHNPVVYATVITFVVAILLLAALVILWIAGSVASHIRNRRWIRRIAGLEPQELHQNSAKIERAYEDVRNVVEELREEKAELITTLHTANERMIALHAENALLRELAGGSGRQLRLGEQP